MRTFEAIEPLRQALASLPRPLALVPTMGALHEGHLQLVRAARDQCATVVVSVFVNPMQFAAGEDFDRYPRDYAGDGARLECSGGDILFAPAVDVMYPPGFSTIVDVGDLGSTYEGAARPTHFRGVTTVVAKLLHAVGPDVLYLGQKDAQQTAVLRKLVRDLDFSSRVQIVPTVREADGLALSSRNAYLSPQERAAAPSLHAALESMHRRMHSGAAAVQAREDAMRVLAAPGDWEYLDAVDMDTYLPLEFLRVPAFLIGAARFGTTRLLDNLMILEQSEGEHARQ